MRYFDVTDLPTPVDKDLVKRLGFQKILNNKTDVIITEKASREYEKPFLIATNNPAVIHNLIGANNAIGVLVDQNELTQKILDKIRENKKVIVFNSCHIISGQEDRIARLHRTRRVFRLAHKSDVDSAIASLANKKEYLLSAIQLLEVAKMIASDDREAKRMLINLGEMIDDIQKKE